MNNYLDCISNKSLYVVMHNGFIESSNVETYERLNKSELDVSSDLDFILIHKIDQDCNITINIFEDIKANIIEVFYVSADVLVNKTINVLKNGNLSIVTIEHNNNSHTMVNAKTNISEKAYIVNKKLSLLTGSIKENDYVNINGDKAYLENYSVYIDSFNSVQNIDLTVKHSSLNSQSIMTNYGICKGKSVLNINTDGIIDKGAKGTNIRQKTKGIIIDNEATISANPILHIDEFDCFAGHGAGIGAIDEKELYYLMSRGLTREDSEKLIIGGFVYPIFEAINDSELKKVIEKLVKKFI